MPDSQLLVAVAAHGLAGSRTDLPSASLSPIEWFDLARACAADDLVGFLARAAADAAFRATEGQAEELSVLDAEHAGLSLLVERHALTMASLLAAAGIPYRVVDGPARRLAYGETGARHWRTVQILVPPARLDVARALVGLPAVGARGHVVRQERVMLRTVIAGASPGVPPDPSGAVATSDDAGARRGTSPGASAADLSSPFAPSDPGGPDPLELLGEAADIEVAGRSVAVLTIEQQIVIACLDLADAPVAPLVQLRDVAQLALSPDLDGRKTRRLAQRLGATSALARVVALAWETFDLADRTELSVWALRLEGAGTGVASELSGRRQTRAVLARRLLRRRQPAPAGAPLRAAVPSGRPAAPAESRSQRSAAASPATTATPTNAGPVVAQAPPSRGPVAAPRPTRSR
jgi:hypothetical protein